MPRKKAKTKLCFVIGPLGVENSAARIHSDWLLEEIIRPTMMGFSEFQVIRSDEISDPGLIDAQIIKLLLKADLVIADLSMTNPNAFYEIGIRHMTEKPIIHVQLAEERIPFDVSLFRSIKFSRLRPSDLRIARLELKRQVEAVLTDGYDVQNPVVNARRAMGLDSDEPHEVHMLKERIKALEKQLGFGFRNRHDHRAAPKLSHRYRVEWNQEEVKLPFLHKFITGKLGFLSRSHMRTVDEGVEFLVPRPLTPDELSRLTAAGVILSPLPK